MNEMKRGIKGSTDAEREKDAHKKVRDRDRGI